MKLVYINENERSIMKNLGVYGYIFLIIVVSFFVKTDPLLAIKITYGFIFFFLPILVSCIMTLICNRNNAENQLKEFSYLKKFVREMVIYLLLIVFTFEFITVKQFDNMLFILNLLYYFSFFIWLVVINYLSIRCDKSKKCMKVFMNEILNFFKENFTLNAFAFLLIIFFKNVDSVGIGLAGSYIFFILTTIHSEYKKNIKAENKGLKLSCKICQGILLLTMFIAFTNIEEMINSYYKYHTFTLKSDYIFKELLFIMAIILNSYSLKIDKLLKKKDD